MRHPVSVVIPTIESRLDFLMKSCLPSVYANRPSQVIVVGGDDWNGNEKRNSGAQAARQPYLLFVDDDSAPTANAVERMLAVIQSTGADIVYGCYRFTVACKTDFKPPVGLISPGKWNPDRLKRENYIATTSLIRASAFPGFDPKILRFQDWDLWLTMAAAGARGVYIPDLVVEKFVIDQGISARVPEDEARTAIARKHGL